MKPCCRDLGERVETQVRPDMVVSVCQVCGLRHFELTVDPGSLGLKGVSL